MRGSCQQNRLQRCIAGAVCLSLVLGCDPVREDRRISFSKTGDQVAFQHGSDGVFIADPQSGELRKVFDPDNTIVAVGAPQWSDDDKFAVFTTARDANQADPAKATSEATSPHSRSASLPAAWEDAPAGRLFFPQPIVYTCWLIERAPDGNFNKPTQLFEARANHVGYVASNWAVRLNPRKKQLLFVDRDSPVSHAVWSFDVETKRKDRVFPPARQPSPVHVIADFSPDGSRLLCVAATTQALRPVDAKSGKSPPTLDGIWIRGLGEKSWWHVVESVDGSMTDRPGGLSSLVEHRPEWTKDGSLIAFTRLDSGSDPARPHSLVFQCRVADRTVKRLFDSPGDVSDLQWSPDGSQLGFITSQPAPTLKFIDRNGRISQPLPGRLVRNFAGWNAAGDKWACVVAEAGLPKPKEDWAFLLLRDPLARDSVLVSESSASSRAVASGLRFTFPQWSPKRDQLSMWGTFSPSHISLASDLVGIGLRPGDPAAIVDVATGGIRWMAVNGDECAQVGHYHTLKHDYAQAREWYRKADKKLPKPERLRPAEVANGLLGIASRRRTFEFFYWHCLTKLGEPKEAAAHLAAFDEAYRIEWPPAKPSSTNGPPANVAPGTASKSPRKNAAVSAPDPARVWSSKVVRRDAENLTSIAKALAIAQVFLSIDDPEGAQSYFRARLDSPERLANLIALSQLELLQKQNREYAVLVTNQLAPLLAESLEEAPSTTENPAADPSAAIRSSINLLMTHALGPLFCDQFVKELPAQLVGQFVTKWDAIRQGSKNQTTKLYADLFLRVADGRLGRQKDRLAATERLKTNPMRSQLPAADGIEAYFDAFRTSVPLPSATILSAPGRPHPDTH